MKIESCLQYVREIKEMQQAQELAKKKQKILDIFDNEEENSDASL